MTEQVFERIKVEELHNDGMLARALAREVLKNSILEGFTFDESASEKLLEKIVKDEQLRKKVKGALYEASLLVPMSHVQIHEDRNYCYYELDINDESDCFVLCYAYPLSIGRCEDYPEANYIDFMGALPTHEADNTLYRFALRGEGVPFAFDPKLHHVGNDNYRVGSVYLTFWFRVDKTDEELRDLFLKQNEYFVKNTTVEKVGAAFSTKG